MGRTWKDRLMDGTDEEIVWHRIAQASERTREREKDKHLPISEDQLSGRSIQEKREEAERET